MMMKAKIKLMAFVAGLLATLPMTSAWASSEYSYSATLTGSADPTGAGSVYVADTEENAKAKKNLGTYTKSGSSDQSGNDVSVTLYAYAVPNAGYEFTGWTGATATDGDTCSVSLTCTSKATTQSASVTANFAMLTLPEFAISFVTDPSAGTYTVDGAAPANKTGLINVTSVKLASSDPNFLNWKVNDAVITDNPYTATCLADTTISTVFLTADQVAEATTYDELTAALTNDGKKKVIIPSGTELVVAKGAMLTVPAGKQLVVDGTLWALGTVSIVPGAQVMGNGSLVRSYKTIFQDATVHVPFPDGTDGVAGTGSGVNGVDGTAGKYLVTSVKEDANTVTGSFSCKEEFVVTVENKASGKTFYTPPSLTKPVGVLCTTAREKALNWIDGVNQTVYSDVVTLLNASATSAGSGHAMKDHNKLAVLMAAAGTVSYSTTANSSDALGFIVDLAGQSITLKSASAKSQWNSLKLVRIFNGSVTIPQKVMNTNFCVYNCTGSFGYLSGSSYYTAISFYDSPGVKVTWNDMSSTTPAGGQNYYGGATYNTTNAKFQTTPGDGFNNVYSGTFVSGMNPTKYLYDTNKVTAEQDPSQSNAWVVKKIIVDPNKGQVKVNGQESTLADALANAKAGDSIVLQRDVELESELTLAAQNIRLDLSGWKLTGTSAIVNNGDLEIIDSNGKGQIGVPVINNGTLLLSDAVYNGAITLNQGFCYFLAGTFNGGISVAQTVTDPTAIAEVVGGTYATLTYALGAENPQLVGLCKNGYVVDGKIAQIPESYVTSSTFASYQVKALSPNDETLYNRGGARSKYSREEWIRYKAIRASAELFSSWGIDCAVTPDRKLAANDISVVAGGLYSVKVDEEIAANHAYSAFFQAMRKSGMASAPWMYGSILPGGEHASQLSMALKNEAAQNGTIVAVEMRLATGVRNMSGPKDWSYTTYVTTSQKLLVFGNSSGNVAMIRPAEGAATFYADLASAMGAVADNGTVMLANDCATALSLPKAGTYTFDPMCFEMTDVAPVVGEGLRIESTSTADSAAAALKPGAKATTYVVVDASVVEGAGGTKYPSVAAAIAGETGNEIALTVTANVTETVAVPAGKKVTITVAEGVESKLTVNPDEGAFLVEAKNGATTSYEAKRITEKPVLPTSGVSAKEVSGGNTNDVADASALVTRLMGNAAIERVDNTTVAVLDKVEVTPTMIIDIKSGDQDVIEAATFDVVPKAKEGQSLGETMIKFRLPVEAATDKASAKVYHDGAFFGVLPVSSETVGETVCKFVEVESNAFSPYGYELLGGAEDPVAIIDSVGYATLAAALDAAQAGDTVTLLKDIEGVTNAFEITKAITLNGNGHKIVAAVNENPRDMLSAYLGARVMFQVRSAEGVTFQDLTVDGGETHYYTFLAETKGGVFTVENTQWLHGGEASAGDVAGVGYGAAIHVNGGILLANGSFRSYTGGKEAGVFPFTGILYDDGGIHFDDEATATIGDDLLLVGMTGAPDVSTEEGKAYVEELLAAMNVPVGFAPYTLKLGDDSSLAFTGASPLGWNGIIDYGKQIMDVAGEIGYEGMDKEKTPVEVGLLTDTVLPEVFSFGDTNLTVNGNGNALSGEITYTDNAGFIEDIKLGAENPLVLDMTEVTKPVLLGSGIVVSNLIIKMTPEQAVAGTPVVTWSTDDGAVAPAVHSDVKVYLPTGETKDLIWDAEMGLAYIGPVEARLTGPTHEKPVYTSFAEAIAQAAESGDTVTLMTNLVNYVGTQGINKSLTLDGAGHKIVAKPVTIHRDIFSSYVQSTSMLKLQSGEITIKNLTLDGDASHAYTYLVSADNSNVSLTTENVNLFHGGELMGDESGAVKAAGAGYGAAVHLNNGATMVVKDGFFACTGGKEAGVFPFTGILVDSNGADVTFDLTDDSDTNPTVGIGSDLLLVGMPEAIDAETAQGLLDEMKVPTRFIPYTLTLDDGSAYAFTGASPLGWNAIIDYGKQIMDVAGEMGYEGLDKETTPIEVGLLTDAVLPDMFTFGDTNLTVNGNGNALSGEIKYTDNAGFIENIELGTEQMPLVIDLTGSTVPVKMGEEITVTDLIIKMTPEQAKSGTAVIVWPEGDKPENPDYVTVAVVDPETFEPTGTKTLVWDEELRIAYIGPVEARLTGANHEPVYTTLAEAMSQAESGDTVKMLSDVALTNGINVTTAVTLDLNGKEIGGQSETMKVGEGKALTINDNSEEGTGVIATSILNDGGTLIITSGTFERPISASEKVTDPATAFALSGGTYSEDVIHLSGGETVPLDDVCVDGYEAVYNGNNTWSVVPDRDTVAFEPKSDDPDRIEVTFGEGAGEKVPVVVSDAWVRENFEDYYGTEETKPAAADVNALLDETQANGLKGWQNYLLGFDGSETVKPLSPDATAAGDQEHVIVKSFKPVTLPKLNMGISAEFVLGKGTPTRDAAGEITSWSWTDVQTLDEPTFAVTLASLEAETYWRIKAVFSQVSMEEGSAK